MLSHKYRIILIAVIFVLSLATSIVLKAFELDPGAEAWGAIVTLLVASAAALVDAMKAKPRVVDDPKKLERLSELPDD